jgi:hypothetical protein
MKPSKEAIEAAYNVGYHTLDNGDAPSWFDCQQQELEAAYSIDVAPLEQRIEELEKENEDLKYRLDHVWTRIPRNFAR